MKTVVYQSYRTTDVPRWMARCLESVRQWAAERGFDYHFLDDRIFNHVPTWFRDKPGAAICTKTDVARLVLAHQFLTKGFERTIWVDADMLVFAPKQFTPDVNDEFAFCREVWIYPDREGRAACSHRVNNSVAVFTKVRPFLEFYLEACRGIAADKTRSSHLDVGTTFLTGLRGIMPFRLLENVGTFGPAVLADIANGGGPRLELYMTQLAEPLASANLCSSLRGHAPFGVLMTDDVFEKVVEMCLVSEGHVINRLFSGPNRHIAASLSPGGV